MFQQIIGIFPQIIQHQPITFIFKFTLKSFITNNTIVKQRIVIINNHYYIRANCNFYFTLLLIISNIKVI